MHQAQVKILFISANADTYGGGEGYLLKVIRHLDRLRFAALVVLPEEGNLRAPLEALGAEVLVVQAKYGWVKQSGQWYRRLAEMRQQVNELVHVIRGKGVGLVHTNSNTRLEGALAARIVGIPNVYLAHIARQTDGLYHRLQLDQASFASLMGMLSTRIVAVSQSVATTLAPPLPSSKVRVIHNGIEFDHFDLVAKSPRTDIRKELQLPSESLLITAVGRICWDKGFDILVDAAANVLASMPQAHFLIAGAEVEKQYVQDIRSRVKSSGIGKHFHFLGYRADIPQLLCQTDIFVLSSRIEGHPYVLLEAMAAGCAVIACRCAGVEETVSDRQTAVLTEIGDANGMAEAISSLIHNHELRKSLATAAHDHVRTHFDARRSAEQLMALYDEILAEELKPAGAPFADLFLDAAHDIGTLGLQVLELNQRVNDLENLSQTLRNNPFARAARGTVHWWRRIRAGTVEK